MSSKAKKSWTPDALIRRDGGSWFDGRSIRTYDRDGRLIDQRRLKPGDRVEALVATVVKRSGSESRTATPS